MRRFAFDESLAGVDRTTLSGADHHYLTHVLRLTQGDSFDAVDANRHRYRCTITGVGPESCEIGIAPYRIGDPAEPETRYEPRITLFQALPKGQKLDTIVRQATECGVSEIVPIVTAHCIAELPEQRIAGRLERWNRIAREAVQQSGAIVPEIRRPIRIGEIPRFWENRGPALVFHQDCLDSSMFLDTLSQSPERIAICIGPEGGFAEEEVSELSSHGFTPIYLGERVLRTETAAIYAIAAVQIYIKTVYSETRA